MIGAMPAVAVRHERRKNKPKDKLIRPSRLQIQQMKAEAANNEALSPGGLGSENPSHNPSRVGTPLHHLYNNGDLGIASAEPGNVRYGDECFFGKVSLLHFIVFFLLGGLTVLVVGAVQFKREAGLAYLRFHFLFAGAILIAFGCLLLVIKCLCYRIPLPDEDETEDMEDEKEEDEDVKKLRQHIKHSPITGDDTSHYRLSPQADRVGAITPERRVSHGDTTYQVKNPDEMKSLLTIAKAVDAVDKKKDISITIKKSGPDGDRV